MAGDGRVPRCTASRSTNCAQVRQLVVAAADAHCACPAFRITAVALPLVLRAGVSSANRVRHMAASEPPSTCSAPSLGTPGAALAANLCAPIAKGSSAHNNCWTASRDKVRELQQAVQAWPPKSNSCNGVWRGMGNGMPWDQPDARWAPGTVSVAAHPASTCVAARSCSRSSCPSSNRTAG